MLKRSLKPLARLASASSSSSSSSFLSSSRFELEKLLFRKKAIEKNPPSFVIVLFNRRFFFFLHRAKKITSATWYRMHTSRNVALSISTPTRFGWMDALNAYLLKRSPFTSSSSSFSSSSSSSIAAAAVVISREAVVPWRLQALPVFCGAGTLLKI